MYRRANEKPLNSDHGMFFNPQSVTNVVELYLYLSRSSTIARLFSDKLTDSISTYSSRSEMHTANDLTISRQIASGSMLKYMMLMSTFSSCAFNRAKLINCLGKYLPYKSEIRA